MEEDERLSGRWRDEMEGMEGERNDRSGERKAEEWGAMGLY